MAKNQRSFPVSKIVDITPYAEPNSGASLIYHINSMIFHSGFLGSISRMIIVTHTARKATVIIGTSADEEEIKNAMNYFYFNERGENLDVENE